MTVRRGAGLSYPYLIIGDWADTRIVLLEADGTMNNMFNPASSGLTDVRFAKDFSLNDSVPYIYARNGRDAGTYVYVLFGGGLQNQFSATVEGYTADDPAEQAQADERIAAEQARLDALGVGA